MGNTLTQCADAGDDSSATKGQTIGYSQKTSSGMDAILEDTITNEYGFDFNRKMTVRPPITLH